MSYVAGRRPVKEALLGRRQVSHVYLARGAGPSESVNEIVRLAETQNIPTVMVMTDQLDQWAGGVVHQGVVARIGEFRYSDMADLVRLVDGKEQALIVALDGVEDPQNFGAITRTAVGAGVNGLIIRENRAVSVTPAVVKASAGAIEYAVIVKSNISSAIDRLKSEGFWIIGTDGSAPAPIWDLDLKGRIVLVLGGEHQGLSRLVKSKCDFLAKLPMSRKISSLNVSAAAAAIIYEAVKQRA
ncbi:MAG TPA: 23S rRNA (guanosine(2251)-2'-O)-methyltransferase RlmB [Actinobacteria bacterium]|nr:23S rRNA (guanosine(2251)-2'-O)-methyltransferase RlmB [Actinomycetota bacterium]